MAVFLAPFIPTSQAVIYLQPGLFLHVFELAALVLSPTFLYCHGQDRFSHVEHHLHKHLVYHGPSEMPNSQFQLPLLERKCCSIDASCLPLSQTNAFSVMNPPLGAW